MKTFGKILRLFLLLFFITVASLGMISIFPNFRDRYLNNEIKTEQVNKKEDETDAEEDVNKN